MHWDIPSQKQHPLFLAKAPFKPENCPSLPNPPPFRQSPSILVFREFPFKSLIFQRTLNSNFNLFFMWKLHPPPPLHLKKVTPYFPVNPSFLKIWLELKEHNINNYTHIKWNWTNIMPDLNNGRSSPLEACFQIFSRAIKVWEKVRKQSFISDDWPLF